MDRASDILVIEKAPTADTQKVEIMTRERKWNTQIYFKANKSDVFSGMSQYYILANSHFTHVVFSVHFM